MTSSDQPQNTPAREWIGGFIQTPFTVGSGDDAMSPVAVFWLEMPTGVVVGTEMCAPDQTGGAVGRLLQQSMTAPIIGDPRRPSQVRVASAVLADEVRGVLGEEAAVHVAPTPEMSDVLESMVGYVNGQAAGDDEAIATYLGLGDVDAETVAAMFEATAGLFRRNPWEQDDTPPLLRVDIPDLDVDGACLSIMGEVSESPGLMLFPSRSAFASFAEASQDPVGPNGELDMGSGWLSLNFERGAELDDAMRQEVAEHDWTVAAPEAYPLVSRYERDLTCLAPDERDVRIVGAVAAALSAYLEAHGNLAAAPPEPLSHVDDLGGVVQIGRLDE